MEISEVPDGIIRGTLAEHNGDREHNTQPTAHVYNNGDVDITWEYPKGEDPFEYDPHTNALGGDGQGSCQCQTTIEELKSEGRKRPKIAVEDD
ncbi:hypothetical protein [Haloarchaeobius sp. DFWS5]|uniref:hypothetical protein n=1 Tax=Haloarchaeobius sp. DFWS5 TaxID=3446114 RepID=UPI003EBCBC9A